MKIKPKVFFFSLTMLRRRKKKRLACMVAVGWSMKNFLTIILNCIGMHGQRRDIRTYDAISFMKHESTYFREHMFTSIDFQCATFSSQTIPLAIMCIEEIPFFSSLSIGLSLFFSSISFFPFLWITCFFPRLFKRNQHTFVHCACVVHYSTINIVSKH